MSTVAPLALAAPPPPSALADNGWTVSIERLLRLWLRQFQINQQLEADEAQWYERMYNVLSVIEAVASASAVVESASALSQFGGTTTTTTTGANDTNSGSSDTVVLVLLIVLLVTSGINTIVNRLRAFLAPDVRARVAREMSAAHSSLARKIDVELHLHKARRRPASDVLYETLERYESIISTGSAVRLDRDLPNATALRSWFCGNDLDGGGATRPRGDSDARNATATATWPRAVHIAPPDPTAPSPSPVVPDHVVDTLNNNDDEFLRRDTRSRAVMDLLDYQMTRLAESV